MPLVARIGDSVVGSCGCDHGSWSGVWIQGSPDVDSESPKQIRLNDICVITCPCGIGWASSGSPDVDSNGIKEHRIADQVVCACGSGLTVSSAATVDDNG
jgi:hypothetical protein